MAKVLVGLYVVLVAALLAAAVAIWRLHCEGFGCMGVGVAWVAWVAVYAVVLLVGLMVRGQAATSAGFMRACKATWWLQLAMGAVLLGLWLPLRVA